MHIIADCKIIRASDKFPISFIEMRRINYLLPFKK